MKRINYGMLLIMSLMPLTWADELSLQEKTFEHAWNAFEKEYSLFGAKNINWKALYKIYRPQVTSAASDEELFEILSSMLAHLNDNHVHLLWKERERYFSAGYSYQLATEHGIDDYLKLIQQKPAPQTYFKNGWESRFDNIFLFGWLENNIGYVHFDCFVNPEKSAEVMDEVVQTFKDADAMIVDVRHNSGGNDQVGKVIADRFADDKRLYMVTKIRIGPGYEDFGPPKYWHVEPASPRTFTKPVILLTDRTSVSAAENFTLAMRVLPHVTIVGDTTSGCHADSKGINLPNGWTVTVPFNLFLDPNGFCWEGIGIPPDIRQINTKNDLEAGRDRILELAIELLKTGGFVYSKNRKLYPIGK